MARPSPAIYFKPEMRRIAFVGGLIFAILVVLIFVL
jgi:hypothetical protein